MDEQELKELISAGLSAYSIAKKLNFSERKVSYWLKKYKLETQHKVARDIIKSSSGTSHCFNCKQSKPVSEFYQVIRNGKPAYHSYCKDCSKLKAKPGIDKKRIAKKQFAIEYKGGKCSCCGYVDCSAALDFHHLDPSVKESSIADMIHKRSISENDLKKELDKCILVCCRCHREIHAGHRKIS